ncbi:hypothetical protein GCM10009626_23400 [Brachybacterium sacelli]
MDARDLQVQSQRDVGKGQPVGDEVIEVVHAPSVPRPGRDAHPLRLPPERRTYLTVLAGADRVSVRASRSTTS